MSSITINNNTLVFGYQSPLYRVVSESGLKENLTRMIVDKSTVVYRKRAFDTYLLANSIFPNKVAEVNDNVKYAIGKLLDPFVSGNVRQIEDIILKTPRQKYSQGEVYLTSEIAKATGVKNTLVMIADSERESSTSGHGIITYLTRNVVNGTCSQIDAGWSNKFFNFKDAANLSILVIIPKQYLASLFIHTIPEETKKIGDVSLDKLALKGSLIDNFAIDLIKSFFSAIYSDGIRSRVTSDILLLNTLLQKEGSLVTTIADETGGNLDTACDAFAKYAIDLHQFKASSNQEHFVYELLKMSQYSNVILNPYEFYKGFIDVPYCQIENVFQKIPSFNRFNSGAYYASHNFSNNLSEMDIFFEDKDRDIVIYGIKLLRFLPFMLFNTYVIGGGAYGAETRAVLSSISPYITSLLSYRASNAASAPIVKFITDNLNYLINDFAKQIASPLSVTSNSKKAITLAIGKHGIMANPDDEDSVKPKLSLFDSIGE